LRNHIIGLEIELQNLVREKNNSNDMLRQMKEDMTLVEREISNLKSLNNSILLEKKRLTEMIKRHNRKAPSKLIDFEIFKKEAVASIN